MPIPIKLPKWMATRMFKWLKTCNLPKANTRFHWNMRQGQEKIKQLLSYRYTGMEN